MTHGASEQGQVSCYWGPCSGRAVPSLSSGTGKYIISLLNYNMTVHQYEKIVDGHAYVLISIAPTKSENMRQSSTICSVCPHFEMRPT